MMRVAVLVAMLLLAACAGGTHDAAVLERASVGPAQLGVQAEGELHAAKSTPLAVPGQQWAQRQLDWMLPDGSWVKKNEVVARFSAATSKLELSDALLDLQRNALARAAKQADLGATQGQLQVDMTQVAGQLAIAQRYAHAQTDALARNTILDAVQDEHFLGVKQDVLNWREGTASKRGKAELALIDAQRASSDLTAKLRREDLAALEIRAPHAGLLVLKTDWSGDKPRIGASMWAGNTFADLPDTTNMEVEMYVPQAQAQGLKPGLTVDLSPLGVPVQKVSSKISWVAAAAAARNRQSPVKYLALKASVPADAVERYRWTPGQRFVATIVLLRSAQALTVPNIAIDSSGKAASVSVRVAGHDEKRRVTLGVRGPSRSQVLDGLHAGDEVVIAAAAKPGTPKSSSTRSAAPLGEAAP